MLVFIRDLGSSLMYFGGFLALLYVATNRLSFVVVGLLLFAVGAWFIRLDASATSRTASTSGWTRSRRSCVEHSGYQIAQSPVRAGRRRAVRHRLRARRCSTAPAARR